MRRALMVLALVGALVVPGVASAAQLTQPGYLLRAPVVACEKVYRGKTGIHLNMKIHTTVVSRRPLWVRLQMYDYTRRILNIPQGDLTLQAGSPGFRTWRGANPDGDSLYHLSVFLPRYGEQGYQVIVGVGGTAAAAFADPAIFGGFVAHGPGCP